ncbi:probable zinc metallopeptidase EGY3, chloroplastic [Aristolochia californica]|uniref:probable zinc metallopeptidase EGY3, chloroplastic n=1 Tax=Aristolochia californica TaxID=171875 RepID=UPI0035DE35C7
MASWLLLNPSIPPLKTRLKPTSVYSKHPLTLKTGSLYSPCSSQFSKKRLIVNAANEDQSKPTSSTATIIQKDEESSSEPSASVVADEKKGEDELERTRQQETDWKTDEEFKKFMGNPSIEAAIKLEKKRADRKLKELDIETDGNPISGFFKRVVRDRLAKEKERLEKAEEAFKALDLNKVCVVQPKAEIDLQFESTKLSTPWGYISAIALCVTTFGTIALMSGFFLKPGATFDDYIADVIPLFGGFLTILGVSEITTRLTAAHHGVKLSPSFLVPSNWTGCLGVMNNYESLLPNKKALFDIPVARTASAYLTSLALAISAFVVDGSFNGGDNALYVRPQFFYNNPLLSFIQLAIGPYADDLGNVLPNAVEGVGVPVDPLAFAGLLGIVVTSLNLLPCGRLEGGRIAQALFGRNVATLLSFGTSLLLGIGGLSGSVLCLAWGLFATFFRGGEEIPAKDEITPMGDERYAWGFVLAVVCFLTLLPNGGGTFSSSFFNPPFFRGDL